MKDVTMQDSVLYSLLETSAVVTTVIQFLSGVVVCQKFVEKKSTGEASGFPFICGFLSCSLWLRYGILTLEESVILVNMIGVALMFIYSIIYFKFAVNKRSYLRQFLILLSILIIVTYYTGNVVDVSQSIKAMGIVCCVVTVCFYGAPLTMLLHVMRAKSCESLPFPLIAMSFIVTLQWLIYGIVINDTFIQIPNFLGCLLSLLQLSLFVCYPPKGVTKPSYKLVDAI